MCEGGLDTKKKKHLIALHTRKGVTNGAFCHVYTYWCCPLRTYVAESTVHCSFSGIKSLEHHENSKEQCLKQHCCRIAQEPTPPPTMRSQGSLNWLPLLLGIMCHLRALI